MKLRPTPQGSPDAGGAFTRADQALLYGCTDQALDAIHAERLRQLTEEGYTPRHDEAHGVAELAMAAAAYAWHVAGEVAYRRAHVLAAYLWPWHHSSWKPRSDERDLVRAGALIVAALELLLRERVAQADVEAG